MQFKPPAARGTVRDQVGGLKNGDVEKEYGATNGFFQTGSTACHWKFHDVMHSQTEYPLSCQISGRLEQLAPLRGFGKFGQLSCKQIDQLAASFRMPFLTQQFSEVDDFLNGRDGIVHRRTHVVSPF
ncbi:hypothetical protein XH86_14125 [Bradyrhizobium guangdongense]|uniref:Uncharacterized protein n=1 Tax=Bradyrhizobium guangdongense TaxID=1325090 RepID=A0ABX6UI27_9BRAD|nr:hypothetical protein X265_14120 [Bradyrhizobium guangdongense]QOZ59739.1 hypothetical protein XH86_14125 [Bradyrhizobium guangdongense]